MYPAYKTSFLNVCYITNLSTKFTTYQLYTNMLKIKFVSLKLEEVFLKDIKKSTFFTFFYLISLI